MNKEKIISEFENMRDFAELKALLNYSLEQPLTDTQFKRIMELKEKILKNE